MTRAAPQDFRFGHLSLAEVAEREALVARIHAGKQLSGWEHRRLHDLLAKTHNPPPSRPQPVDAA